MSLRIVYLHGLGGQPEPAAVFLESLADRLSASDIEVVAPDLRRSTPVPAEDSILEAFARRVSPREERRRRDRAILFVGHSVGGLIATVAADETREVAGLCLLEAAFFDDVMSPFRPYVGDGGAGRSGLIDALEEQEDPTPAERRYLSSLRQTPPQLFDRLGAAMLRRGADLGRRAKRLETPSLYVAGEDSVGERARSWAESAPGGRADAAIIEDSGHSPHRERARHVADTCGAWFERATSRGG